MALVDGTRTFGHPVRLQELVDQSIAAESASVGGSLVKQGLVVPPTKKLELEYNVKVQVNTQTQKVKHKDWVGERHHRADNASLHDGHYS
jgi:uncharacterized membrane protein YqiK